MPEPRSAREIPAGMAQEMFKKRQNLLNRESIGAVKGCVEQARFVLPAKIISPRSETVQAKFVKFFTFRHY